jgi:hypothetical protein
MMHLIREISQFFVEIWLGVAFWYTTIGVRTGQRLAGQKMGEIKTTGVKTVCRRVNLPAKFVVTAMIEPGDGTLTLCCLPEPGTHGDITWLNPTQIQIGPDVRELIDSPSSQVIADKSQRHPAGETLYPAWQERIQFTVRLK